MLLPVRVGFRFPSAEALLAKAQSLAGHTSGELASAVGRAAFNVAPEATGKTGVGDLVELYLGKVADSESEPDFAHLGIELKTLPMKRVGPRWTVKEPTSITMINYHRVQQESWRTAGVKRKVEHILWVPYEHNYEDKRRAVFRRAFLWSPATGDDPIFADDYARVRSLVDRGKAHELSESLCRVLAPRRKGSKGQTTTQPMSPERAKTRAWAFKVAYTRPILERHVLATPIVSLIEDVGAVKSLADVENYVSTKLGAFEGLTLGEIERRTGGRIAGGKSGPASFVRALLGVKPKGTIEEFEKLGVRAHTVWARTDDLLPWEAISFPAMRLREFAEETWGESELEDHIDRILFIPLLSTTRPATRDRVLGRAFFWSPSRFDWPVIHREWRDYQIRVQQGKAKYRLAPSGARGMSEATEDPEGRIHVRPHARNAADTDLDPHGNVVTKQCFWLNRAFVHDILRSSIGRDGRAPRAVRP